MAPPSEARRGSTAHEVRALVAPLGRDLAALWKPLAAADLVCQALALVVLAPLTTGLLHLAMARAGRDVVADADLPLFFVETRAGLVALVLICTLTLAVGAFRQACLMTLAITARRGAPVRLRDAMGHAAAHLWPILRLTFLIVVRLLGLAVPFLAGIGLTYWGLLREHDVNYFLREKPPSFLLAVAIVGALVAAAAIVLLRRITAWLVSLPALLFERALPFRALAASHGRMKGHRTAAAWALLLWGGVGWALHAAAWGAFNALGRAVAPAFGGSVTLLLLFVSALALVGFAVLAALGILTRSALALLIVELYDTTGAPRELDLPARGSGSDLLAVGRLRLSWRAVAGVLAACLALALLVAHLQLRSAWVQRPVLVIAHRGAAGVAPENTLAAFRRAIEEGADVVELDVQESLDGVVVVVHDSDLMKVAGVPTKIWETAAAALRQVDVGSHFAPEFRAERVPTLAEALELCRGRARVDIELKSYGHAERLEERVVEVVEAAGIAGEVLTMSMDHDMVRTMERLRPQWPNGVLTAVAAGDLVDEAPGDFLAVSSGMATRALVRHAHRRGKPVYVWTVNDPAQMLAAIANGVDGLITDEPALAREVVDRHAAMERSERLLVARMIRFGARDDLVPTEDELRP